MRCRYCKKFRDSVIYSKSLGSKSRMCPHKETFVNQNDDIFEVVKKTKEFCPEFELADMFYCEGDHQWKSVTRCIRQYKDPDEYMDCYKCKQVTKILDMKKLSYMLSKKRAKKIVLKPLRKTECQPTT